MKSILLHHTGCQRRATWQGYPSLSSTVFGGEFASFHAFSRFHNLRWQPLRQISFPATAKNHRTKPPSFPLLPTTHCVRVHRSCKHCCLHLMPTPVPSVVVSSNVRCEDISTGSSWFREGVSLLLLFGFKKLVLW